MEAATLVATLATPPSPEGEELEALPPGVGILEVRADRVGDLDPDWLRSHFSGKLLYTLRSREEGGAFEGSERRRHQRLVTAARRYDLVDLEGERDLASQVLSAAPPDRRILSWHGPTADAVALQRRFRALAEVPARLYKLIPAAGEPGEGLAPLELLQTLERRDVIAFAAGESGTWTRLLAPYLGAPVVYGSLGEVSGAPGQPTIQRLVDDFGLPELRPVAYLCGVVGNPVHHSLSPRLHNGAYRALGIPALYLPFQTRSFGDFWLDLVESSTLETLGMPLRGLSVTAPFKEAALAVAGATSPLAEGIGGANTLVLHEGVWEAESTDPEGVVRSIQERSLAIAERTAAVVGCGGGGRAAAAGLKGAGARVTLVNRRPERGEKAAKDLKLPFVLLSEFDPSAFQILVNATPVGRKEEEPLPFPVEPLQPGAVVVDLVYGLRPTRLIQEARARGRVGIDGREVLLYQAVGQFRLMTGADLPLDLGRRLLGLEEAR